LVHTHQLATLVATVVSLIDSCGVAVRKLSTKRNSISLWKKYDIVDNNDLLSFAMTTVRLCYNDFLRSLEVTL